MVSSASRLSPPDSAPQHRGRVPIRVVKLIGKTQLRFPASLTLRLRDSPDHQEFVAHQDFGGECERIDIQAL